MNFDNQALDDGDGLEKINTGIRLKRVISSILKQLFSLLGNSLKS